MLAHRKARILGRLDYAFDKARFDGHRIAHELGIVWRGFAQPVLAGLGVASNQKDRAVIGK